MKKKTFKIIGGINMKKVYIAKDGTIFEGEVADLIEELESLEESVQERRKQNSKGGNIMNKVFNKSRKGKVIEIDKREGKIKRKAKVIGEVVSMSIKGTLNDSWTYAAGASVGLNQGLKYKGDFKAGTKAGLATVAVVAGVNVVGNIILNKEVIKEA